MESTQKVSRKLEKMLSAKEVNVEDAIRYMTFLKDVEMDLDILTKTGVGLIVNKIRKETDNATVTSLAKNLIKQWKKLVPETPDSGVSAEKREANGTTEDGDGEPTEKRRRSEDSDDCKTSTFSNKNNETKDDVRLKCRDMLRQSLETDEVPLDAFDTTWLAQEIETSVFNEFKRTDMKYKNRVRSRVLNIRDTKNPNLRINVLMGQISAEKLARMTSEEMASDDIKLLREKYTKEAIDDHQMSQTGGTTTDLLKCGKCKKTNCTYNQVQTRSSDEPMTTFVYCNNCGNRWKFC